jgi:NifU-like protein involved in Fe-S cluster formation
MLSPLAADHIHHPRHRGPLVDASYGVSGVPGDGPYVEIWARVEDGIVREAAFRTPGCPSSTAAASMLCELAEGREAARVVELTGEDLLTVLGGLPEGKGDYARMSVEAMNRAVGGWP